MSAFSIATGSEIIRRPAGLQGNPTPTDRVLTALGALVKWIPADIVAAYGIAVAMQQAAGPDGVAPPSWLAWWICLIAAPVFVGIVAWTSGKTEHLVWKLVLVVPAFAVWSATIPRSIWVDFAWFQSNAWLGYLVLFLVAALLTLIGQKLAPADSPPDDDGSTPPPTPPSGAASAERISRRAE